MKSLPSNIQKKWLQRKEYNTRSDEGKYRNVETVLVQIISDIPSEIGRLQAWDHKSIKEKSEALLRAVLEALSQVRSSTALEKA